MNDGDVHTLLWFISELHLWQGVFGRVASLRRQFTEGRVGYTELTV